MSNHMSHNPSNLSPSQYGQEKGYRLLEVDEIIEFTLPLMSLELWAADGEWIENSCGHSQRCTYRTKLSREALASARGLTPTSEPEKSDAFDAWIDEERPFDTVNGETNRMRAAFLAGQRSERKEIESALNKLAIDCVDTGGIGWIGSRELRAIAAWIASREPKGAQ